MMRTRFLLLFNASAGRGRTDRVDAVLDELRRRGCDLNRLTDDKHGVLNDAKALSRYDAVIAAGGDGTVRRLLATEAGSACPIGVIPNGTGNVLAHEIGLKLNPVVIADVLMAGPEQPVHTAKIGSSAFLLMLGFGFDGRVIHRLNMTLKGRIGKAAYTGAVLATLSEPPQTFRISVDGKSHAATWAIVSNARHYGGSFMLAPQASLTTPTFEVVLFQSASRLVRLRQLLALATGRIDAAPETSVITGRSVQLEGASSALKAQADGDPLQYCPTEVAPGPTVRLIVPRRYLR